MSLELVLRLFSLAMLLIAAVFLVLTVWTIATMRRDEKVYIQELKPPGFPK